MKTVGFMISDQHLIAHGGIGQFCRSFVKMMREQNHQVVLITDKKPRKGFVDEVNAHWNIYPKTPLSYDKHRKIYGRFSEGPCYEKISNFVTSLDHANNFFNFDMIIANSHESLAALADYKTNSKKILYTHLYKQIYTDVKFKDIFQPTYHTFFQEFLYRTDVIIGTQSEHNKNKLLDQGIKNVEVLPMPITETSLLECSDDVEKSGALYIGRWEAGKNPTDYIKIIKQTKLPAKVLTNKNGEKKFIKAFAENGITNYTIKAGVIGQEKSDFLKSCRIFLNTSYIECFPNSVVETLGHMPVLTLDKVKVPWPNNFEGHCHTINLKKLDIVNDIYANSVDNSFALNYIRALHDSAYTNWSKLL